MLFAVWAWAGTYYHVDPQGNIYGTSITVINGASITNGPSLINGATITNSSFVNDTRYGSTAYNSTYYNATSYAPIINNSTIYNATLTNTVIFNSTSFWTATGGANTPSFTNSAVSGHTTVIKWLTIKDSGGVVLYIPVF